MHPGMQCTEQSSDWRTHFQAQVNCQPCWNYLKPAFLMWIVVGAISLKYSNKWIQDTWTGPDDFSKQDSIALFWQMSPQKQNSWEVIVLEELTSSNVWHKRHFVKIDLINNFQISRNICSSGDQCNTTRIEIVEISHACWVEGKTKTKADCTGMCVIVAFFPNWLQKKTWTILIYIQPHNFMQACKVFLRINEGKLERRILGERGNCSYL